eukprot:TRINITY_DN73366_c0_g1_i1.p1 TRINITY_DN73366_c0_g1~~TRINITY_DN73366_c0_g1_i1.p1  ORF type:complete len:491 (+),score=31.60 TRINITY_DN73366_c0_g1_i1:100-1572(+)
MQPIFDERFMASVVSFNCGDHQTLGYLRAVSTSCQAVIVAAHLKCLSCWPVEDCVMILFDLPQYVKQRGNTDVIDAVLRFTTDAHAHHVRRAAIEALQGLAVAGDSQVIDAGMRCLRLVEISEKIIDKVLPDQHGDSDPESTRREWSVDMIVQARDDMRSLAHVYSSTNCDCEECTPMPCSQFDDCLAYSESMCSSCSLRSDPSGESDLLCLSAVQLLGNIANVTDLRVIMTLSRYMTSTCSENWLAQEAACALARIVERCTVESLGTVLELFESGLFSCLVYNRSSRQTELMYNPLILRALFDRPACGRNVALGKLLGTSLRLRLNTLKSIQAKRSLSSCFRHYFSGRGEGEWLTSILVKRLKRGKCGPRERLEIVQTLRVVSSKSDAAVITALSGRLLDNSHDVHQAAFGALQYLRQEQLCWIRNYWRSDETQPLSKFVVASLRDCVAQLNAVLTRSSGGQGGRLGGRKRSQCLQKTSSLSSSSSKFS